jgi:hypothetical protein
MEIGSPYSPTTTGLVERFNQTLINKLKKLSLFGHKDWEEMLPSAVTVYNISYHRGIG